MIRARDAASLGYLGEASVDTWADAVRAVQTRFPDIAPPSSPATVIPAMPRCWITP